MKKSRKTPKGAEPSVTVKAIKSQSTHRASCNACWLPYI